jgi:predicted nucleotidyltransferase
MDRNEVLRRLKESEAALRQRGVRRAALFGSRARGDDRPGSDIDIFVELDPTVPLTIFDYAGLKAFIAGMFDEPVDVVNVASLKPHLTPATRHDAIYAF